MDCPGSDCDHVMSAGPVWYGDQFYKSKLISQWLSAPLIPSEEIANHGAYGSEWSELVTWLKKSEEERHLDVWPVMRVPCRVQGMFLFVDYIHVLLRIYVIEIYVVS